MINKLKIKNLKSKIFSGVGLIEILVVVAIFAILGVMATRSVLLTLRSSQRSESLIKVRENLDYSLAVMERQLRNADDVLSCGANTDRINFVDSLGNETRFRCLNIGTDDGRVASGSANLRLTSSEIVVTTCSFDCTPSTGSEPPSVTITLEARDRYQTGIGAAKITTATKIFLRSY